jgi:AcrR family transcriptional regulator
MKRAKRGKYNLKQRAVRQQQTRQKIVETTVELHKTLGPQRTTVTDIAKGAGVRRQTVYNHFPDEVSLLMACSAYHRDLNPPPDPASWTEIDDPESRLRRALAEVYRYHRKNEQMTANVTRDAQVNPNLRRVLVRRLEHWERLLNTLVAGWEVSDEQHHKLLVGAVWLALDFQTWRTLVREQGFNDDEAIELMARMVRCAIPN